jgi:hypothetical protein
MRMGDDGATFEPTGSPIGMLVLRARRTPHGVHVRMTSTVDVERSPQGTTRQYGAVDAAVADVAAWLSTFLPGSPFESGTE